MKEDTVEHFISKKKHQELTHLQKGVSRLVLHSSGLNCLSKIFNTWKEFLNHRRFVKGRAAFIHLNLNYLNFSHYWNRWKKVALADHQTSKFVTRKSLIQQIINKKKQIDLLEVKTEINDDEIHRRETVLVHEMTSVVKF